MMRWLEIHSIKASRYYYKSKGLKVNRKKSLELTTWAGPTIKIEYLSFT